MSSGECFVDASTSLPSRGCRSVSTFLPSVTLAVRSWLRPSVLLKVAGTPGRVVAAAEG